MLLCCRKSLCVYLKMHNIKALCKKEMAFNSTVLPPEAVLSSPLPRRNLYQNDGKRTSFLSFVLSTAEKSFICWGKYYFLPLLPLTCVMIFPHQREARDEFLTFRFSVFEILMRLCNACDDCRSRLQSTGLCVDFLFNGRWFLLTEGVLVGLREV